MKRRTNIAMMIAAALGGRGATGQTNQLPIELHVDCKVTPGREQEMLKNYRTIFRPMIRKQPGFVDVRMLKYRSAVAGKAAGDFGYRLVISFKTEEARQTWTKTPEHQEVWPTIEKTLHAATITALLYDTV